MSAVAIFSCDSTICGTDVCCSSNGQAPSWSSTCVCTYALRTAALPPAEIRLLIQQRWLFLQFFWTRPVANFSSPPAAPYRLSLHATLCLQLKQLVLVLKKDMVVPTHLASMQYNISSTFAPHCCLVRLFLPQHCRKKTKCSQNMSSRTPKMFHLRCLYSRRKALHFHSCIHLNLTVSKKSESILQIKRKCN